MYKIKHILVIQIIFSLLVSQISYSENSDINSLLKSEPVKDLTNNNQLNSVSNQTKSSRWLKPGSNFSKLFQTKTPTMLYDWAGHTKTTLNIQNEFCGNTNEFVYLNRYYISKKNEKITLTVLVPHPRYEELIERGLYNNFLKYEPPTLKIKYSENLEIQGEKAELYYHETFLNTCSLLFKLDRESRIILEGPCKETANLKKIAETLSFERFKEKINS